MSRFKVGDKVVFVQNSGKNHDRNSYIGRNFTVKRFYSQSYFSEQCYLVNEDDTYFFMESELEFAEIVNSPLYQALK